LSGTGGKPGALISAKKTGKNCQLRTKNSHLIRKKCQMKIIRKPWPLSQRLFAPAAERRAPGQKIVYNKGVIRDLPNGQSAAGEYRLQIKGFEPPEGDHYGQ
jgi:hypothetical protein